MNVAKIADLSQYQGTIDFTKAKTELDLAIIRVQSGSSTIDRKYKEYVAGCKANKIPFGHYAYTKFVSVNDAVTEARDFLARSDKGAEFLVVDVEQITVRNPADLIPATQAFINYLHNNGVKKVGLYTGHSFYYENEMSAVKADFLWIPRYAKFDTGFVHTAKPTMPCDLWQYTQCGRLAGVTGYVDLSQLMSGGKDLSYFTGKLIVEQSIVGSGSTIS